MSQYSHCCSCQKTRLHNFLATFTMQRHSATTSRWICQIVTDASVKSIEPEIGPLSFAIPIGLLRLYMFPPPTTRKCGVFLGCTWRMPYSSILLINIYYQILLPYISNTSHTVVINTHIYTVLVIIPKPNFSSR